jgi:16S rRNA processing protein RimM
MFKYHTIGEILKPYQSKGELIAVIDVNFIDDVENSKAIFIEIDGLPVPFFVEAIEFDKDLSYVKFEEFSNPEDIKKYNGKKLKLRQIDINWENKNTTLSKSNQNLDGFSIIDIETNEKLIIKKIEEFPQQLMATAVDKDKVIKFIPLVEAFIDKIDIQNKTIYMILPIGLLD